MSTRLLLIAGVVAILAATSVVAQPVTPVVVPIALSEFKYSPSTVTLKVHTAYILRLSDTGSSVHDFDAPEFFKLTTLSPGSVDLVSDGRIKVRPGETKDIEITTAGPGQFPLHCTYPGHSFMGMRGRIEVR